MLIRCAPVGNAALEVATTLDSYDRLARTTADADVILTDGGTAGVDVLRKLDELGDADLEEAALQIANGGEDALEGAAKLRDEGFQRVLRADLSPARQVRALRALDGTNPGELAVSPEGQQLALRMVADCGSDVTTFLRRAEVCSSPCDKVPDTLLELQDGSELTTEELVSLGRQMGKYAY